MANVHDVYIGEKSERTNDMRLNHKGTVGLVGIITATMLFAHPINAHAIDTVTLPTEIYGEDVISVAMPAINENGDSPFDFIIDPQGLIYDTDAAKYGGGSVEEGATLLFRNHEGDYDFSRYSDRLTVRNQSNVPVIVTITASVDDLGEIEMVGSSDFEDYESCSMYLALVDDEGNERAVSENGEVSVSIEMHKAPDNAYIYRINEETGEYFYELSANSEESDFDIYSFGLTGYCNPNGNWQDISVHPSIRVTWKVEPVMSEDDAGDEVDAVETEDTDDAIEPMEITDDIGSADTGDKSNTSEDKQTANEPEDTKTENAPLGDVDDSSSEQAEDTTDDSNKPSDADADSDNEDFEERDAKIQLQV